MDTIPVSETLREWLMGHGMGAGCAAGELAHPAMAQREVSRANLNSGKGRGDGLPRQFTGRENVNSKTGSGDFGEPFPKIVADTVPMGTKHVWVIRTRPSLVLIDCEGIRAHGYTRSGSLVVSR